MTRPVSTCTRTTCRRRTRRGAATGLTDAPERDDYANWGPGDREIVFTSQRDGNIELYLMSPDGSNQRRLTTTIEARENVPDW